MTNHPNPTRYVIAAFDALAANIAILDSTGVIVAVNQSWQNFGQENGALYSDVNMNYLHICEATEGQEKATAQSVAQGIRDVLEQRQAVFEIEYPCHSPNEQRYFIARVTSFRQDGETYAVVTHENITRRKIAELEITRLNATLEARVKERTNALNVIRQQLEVKNTELERRNKDMAQYAYVASHDLQEPLRILGAYTDVLRHRYTGKVLDERAIKYMNHITEQATRARQLVKDTLILSSVVEAAPRSRLSMRVLMDEVSVGQPTPPNSELVCLTDLTVQVNVPQVRQLLTNLLSNAVKFRANDPLHVELSGWVEDQMGHFTLRDNGIGIEPQYAQKVFTMFQRLHNRRQITGNGIGLAVCQRVVEHHGGRIWIEPHPPSESGLTVHFTLPLAPTEPE